MGGVGSGSGSGGVWAGPVRGEGNVGLGWGLVIKPQTFHLVLYPFVVKTECKNAGAVWRQKKKTMSQNLVRSGQMDSKAYGSRGLKLTLVHKLQIHL